MCKVEAAAYVECGKGRTISLPFFCRTLLNDLNACLKKQCVAAHLPEVLGDVVAVGMPTLPTL